MPRSRCCSNSCKEDEESSIADSECTSCDCKQNTYYKRERELCCRKPRLCKYQTHKETSKKSKCKDKKVIIITIS